MKDGKIGLFVPCTSTTSQDPVVRIQILIEHEVTLMPTPDLEVVE